MQSHRRLPLCAAGGIGTCTTHNWSECLRVGQKAKPLIFPWKKKVAFPRWNKLEIAMLEGQEYLKDSEKEKKLECLFLLKMPNWRIVEKKNYQNKYTSRISFWGTDYIEMGFPRFFKKLLEIEREFGCELAQVINTTWENLQIAKHKSVLWSSRINVLLICSLRSTDFFQVVFIHSSNLTHNLLFYFQ